MNEVVAPTATATAARSRRARTPETRVSGEPGYILHATPYKETSLVAHAFTRHHGRVALIAKGAKRPHSALRNALGSLQPLLLDWSGRGEVKTLIGAHWVGGQPPLRGDGLVCGFYLNELLLRLLAREDAHVPLFDEYVRALARLATDAATSATLRAFECALLVETGIGPRWSVCQDGAPVVADARYVCLPEVGVRAVRSTTVGDAPIVDGQTLLDIERGDFSSPATAQQSKLLMRFLINHAMAGRPINTRQLLVDLQRL